MARAEYQRVVKIASGQSLSAEINVAGLQLTAIQMPATWTTANLTFQGALDGAEGANGASSGATFQDLYDGAGGELTITTGQAHTIVKIASNDIDGLRWLKVRSGTGAAAVNQTADRYILLAFTDMPL